MGLDIKPEPTPSSGGGTPSDAVESETTFGLTPDAGVLDDFSRGDHTHGSPADPVPAHASNADAHHDELHAHDGVDGSGTVAHSATTGIGADDHHAQDHAARHAQGGADELDVASLGSGTAAGNLAALSDGTGGVDWAAVAHSDLSGVGADDHHSQAHAHDGADGSGTVAHSATTGQTADDHHNQAHAIDGADHTGSLDHGGLAGLADDDHPQYFRNGLEELRQQYTDRGDVSGAVTLNVANDGNVQRLRLTGNVTLTLAGATNGQACSLTLIVVQDGTGSRLVTWPGSVLWEGGTAPVLSTPANATDLLTLVTVDGGTAWFGFLVGKGMA